MTAVGRASVAEGGTPPVAALPTSTMVLFDWNGTIVLDADRAQDALNRVLAKRGLPVLDAAAFSARFTLPMATMFVGLGVPGPEVSDAEREWNRAMASTPTTLRDGADSALRTLSDAGVLLGVISAASAEAVDFDRAGLGVPDVFTSVEAPVTDKLGRLLTHRPSREAAFYVGDTAYDMRSALAAGFVPVGVSGGYAADPVLWEAGAAHVIHSLAELPALLGADR
ncbi:MAG: phosphoglycolate phosphatase [Subtercola sp.]|nr:phosphoglycolate phosphatase [Subtercola sp.]